MKFKSFTRRHPQPQQQDTPEPADSLPPGRPFNAHPLLWLAVAGHGYPGWLPTIPARPPAGWGLTLMKRNALGRSARFLRFGVASRWRWEANVP